MSGEWIWRRGDVHECELPELDAKSRPGDLWRCECDNIFIVSDSQRDGLYLAFAVEDPATGAWKRAGT